jgi:hypothetical protein
MEWREKPFGIPFQAFQNRREDSKTMLSICIRPVSDRTFESGAELGMVPVVKAPYEEYEAGTFHNQRDANHVYMQQMEKTIPSWYLTESVSRAHKLRPYWLTFV